MESSGYRRGKQHPRLLIIQTGILAAVVVVAVPVLKL